MHRAFRIITFLSCSVILMGQDLFAQTPGFPPVQDLTLPVPDARPMGDQSAPEPGVIYSAMGQSCEAVLNVQPSDPGMIRVDLQAPCLGGRRVDVSWSGFSASYLTSVTGALQVDLPVFEQGTHVQARFVDGTELLARLTYSEATVFTGTGLSWQGDAGVALHVLENGSNFGAVGHRSVARPVGAAGGRMLILGDPLISDGYFSQIYTVPKTRGPLISRVFTEIAVTEVNCGASQAVTLHQPTVNGTWQAMPFEISVPACEKTGESVMLGSPLRDLVLAEE